MRRLCDRWEPGQATGCLLGKARYPSVHLIAKCPPLLEMTHPQYTVDLQTLRVPGWRDQSPDVVVREGLRALFAGHSGELPPGARVVVGADGALVLQTPLGLSLAPVAPREADCAALAEQLRQALDDSALEVDDGSAQAAISPAEEQAQLELLDHVEGILQTLPGWSSQIEFDDDLPALLIAPEEADWALAVLPAASPHLVQALLPIANLPDDAQASIAMLDTVLHCNDLRLLGPDLSMVTTADASALLLQALTPGGTTDGPAWEALLGRMAAAREVICDALEADGGLRDEAPSGEPPVNLLMNAIRG